MRWSSSVVDLVWYNLQRDLLQQCLSQSLQINFSNPVGCSGHHVLGWRNIWDSAEHWSWVERPKGAGEIELCRVLSRDGWELCCYIKCFDQLYNLRPLADSNTLLETEKNQIWIPSITFVNTATQVMNMWLTNNSLHFELFYHFFSVNLDLDDFVCRKGA